MAVGSTAASARVLVPVLVPDLDRGLAPDLDRAPARVLARVLALAPDRGPALVLVPDPARALVPGPARGPDASPIIGGIISDPTAGTGITTASRTGGVGFSGAASATVSPARTTTA